MLDSGRQIETQPSELVSGVAPGDPYNSLLRRIKLLELTIAGLSASIQTTTTTEATAVIVGTHAARIALSVASLTTGTMFYETDFTSLYIVIVDGTKQWRFVA